ncbi:hypothetical protein [Streptomyces ossamyceticus]|uniref:hypothetical protein n=1 Tax=Streptomyces ossamyceticus TaxID=249581 RepID=UPI0006E3270F|nr:hypothetical protein [Streptomyces ossamyceticus]
MTSPEQQTRRTAMALTLHRLRNQDPAAAYELLPDLCKPDPVTALMNLAIHFADATGTALEAGLGSREAAAESLQQQLYKEHH